MASALCRSFSSGYKVLGGVVDKYVGGYFTRYCGRGEERRLQKAADLDEISKTMAAQGYPLYLMEYYRQASKYTKYSAQFYADAPAEARYLWSRLFAPETTVGDVGRFLRQAGQGVGIYTFIPGWVAYFAFDPIFGKTTD